MGGVVLAFDRSVPGQRRVGEVGEADRSDSEPAKASSLQLVQSAIYPHELHPRRTWAYPSESARTGVVTFRSCFLLLLILPNPHPLPGARVFGGYRF
jgi:hypothetical protein